ncbi:MAG: RagB/SusD family nutrient uptake outer membrane protein [Odoribacter sp.]|nr:RagB/SusD family nutrient uptake outer membrane protein [Odoribacter sp.]
MKKILFIFSILIGVILYSCDMDKTPYDSIATDEALESISDFRSVRNGCYSYTKNVFTGDYIIAPEVQADGLHPVIDYSNTYGSFYRWDFTADVGQWGNFYYMINNCNFLIQNSLSKLDNFIEEEQAEIKNYLGEAYFLRALAYEELVLRFCKAYTASTPETELGLPIVTEYAPSSSSSSYPARSSLYDTYQRILLDLEEAAKYITNGWVVNSPYITQDAITALRARVALQMGDYSNALTFAQSLITAGNYPLVSDFAGMNQMWVYDDSPETIFQPAMNATDLGNATGYYLKDKSGSGTNINPDFLPEQGVIDLYDHTNDIRFSQYFSLEEITETTGTVNLYICNKYPGNPDLYPSGAPKMVNKPKVLRIAEMYLIVAEAGAQGNNESAANNALNALKTARIKGYSNQTLSGTALVNEVRNERERELYMEGYRLWDLKRYNNGITRTEPQDPDFAYLYGSSNTTALTKPATDIHWVWPIPTHETGANPQIIQNPGYSNN